MNFQRMDNVADFLEVAEEFLVQRDPETNLTLHNAYGLQAKASTPERPAYMAVVTNGQSILGTAIMDYGRPLCVYAVGEMPEKAMALLVDDLLAWQQSVDGFVHWKGNRTKLVAPEGLAHQFVQVWEQRTGLRPTLGMHMRLYQLRAIRDFGLCKGALGLATEDDKSLVAQWLYEFDKEAVGEMTQDEAVEVAHRMVDGGRMYLWVDDGRPVSQVCKTRPTQRGVVLNAVYTPRQFRKRGYATSCVAAVSQRLLDDGYEFCSLFTDLTNPTSNQIYMKIGYDSIRDYQEYQLLWKLPVTVSL